MKNKTLTSEALRQLNDMLPREKHENYNYQDLASLIQALTGELHAIAYKHEQIPLDQVRYQWIKGHIASIPKATSVTEIGSNLGYISLRLAKELGLHVSCHEPITDYVKIATFIAKELGLERLFQGHAAPVLLKNIPELPKADVIITLNVLHHAGRVFDCDDVRELGGWSCYVQTYLAQLTKKGNYLFFQTGNTWPSGRLFTNIEAPEFLADLLRKSGWQVKDIGIAANLPDLALTSYAMDQIGAIPRIWCQRNTKTGLVDYHQGNDLIASFPTGLAQRPLYFCEAIR